MNAYGVYLCTGLGTTGIGAGAGTGAGTGARIGAGAGAGACVIKADLSPYNSLSVAVVIILEASKAAFL